MDRTGEQGGGPFAGWRVERGEGGGVAVVNLPAGTDVPHLDAAALDRPPERVPADRAGDVTGIRISRVVVAAQHDDVLVAGIGQMLVY